MFIEPTYSDSLLRALLLAPFALFWVIVFVRVAGLRSFSKMTAFDFVVTVATGSLLASAATASDWAGFIQAIAAIAILLAAQVVLARLRRKSSSIDRLIGNEPLMLMREGRFNEPAMRRSRVARGDVFAKLREANALKLSNVRAVVLETTGDISVLHGDAMDDEILDGVRQ